LESEGQSDHFSKVCFLSEAITLHGHTSFSPLAECAIMLTTYGRALSHSQVSAGEQLYGNASFDFWSRHEWIDTMLTERTQSFSLNHPSVSVADDPMVIFTFMVLQTTIICLCKAIEPFGSLDLHKSVVAEYQMRALGAAREIARFSKDIECFKVGNISNQTHVKAYDTDYNRLMCSYP
jgi:hypothetical protein